MAVTLINVFSVPKGKEDEFVKLWENVKTSITKEPGFISGKFHRSPNQIVDSISSMSLWENEDGYWKAYEKSATPMKAKLQQMGVEMTPALFNVIFEY